MTIYLITFRQNTVISSLPVTFPWHSTMGFWDSASKMFQCSMEQIFDGHPCAIIVDGIIMAGRNVDEENIADRSTWGWILSNEPGQLCEGLKANPSKTNSWCPSFAELTLPSFETTVSWQLTHKDTEWTALAWTAAKKKAVVLPNSLWWYLWCFSAWTCSLRFTETKNNCCQWIVWNSMITSTESRWPYVWWSPY